MNILHTISHINSEGMVVKVYDHTNIRELFDDVREYCRKNPTALGYEIYTPEQGSSYLRPEPRYWNTHSFA